MAKKKLKAEVSQRSLQDIDEEICIYKQLLEQMDYSARLVAFETAKILKNHFPEEETPYLDKYLEMENKAEEFRSKIRELENEKSIQDK